MTQCRGSQRKRRNGPLYFQGFFVTCLNRALLSVYLNRVKIINYNFLSPGLGRRLETPTELFGKRNYVNIFLIDFS